MSGEISEQQIMFKLVRIFVAQYLSSVHNIRGFQQEAINTITNYILRIINKLTVETKKIVSLQGRKQANCLHLVNTLQQTKTVEPIRLINFLIKQREQTNKGIRFQYVAFQNLNKRIFETETEEINEYKKQTEYQNVRVIPYNYTGSIEGNDSLPMKTNIDQAFQKPQQFTYKIQHQKIQKNIKNVQQLGNYSSRETKKYLGILNLKNNKNQEEKQKPREQPTKRKQLNNNQFDMINFI